MKAAVAIPNFGEFAEPVDVIALAEATESAGWDGFFIGDHLVVPGQLDVETADTGTLLAAVAARTARVTLGPLITPLARRRPWKFAREAVTLDLLSEGRLVIGTGLGHPIEEWSLFGEESDDAVRIDKLDEALGLIERLWSEENVVHHGRWFEVRGATMNPRPVRSAGIPIWSATYWPPTRPDVLPRAARCDGAFLMVPEFKTDNPMYLEPEQILDAKETIAGLRGNDHFDLILAGVTEHEDDCPEALAACVEAGVTWWVEALGPERGSMADNLSRIVAGPPVSVGSRRSDDCS